jgi:hypothetical protein
MKLDFTLSGGVTGMIRRYTVDTAALPADEGQQVHELVQQSGLSDSVTSVNEQGRDLESYDITIEDGDRRVSAVYDNTTVPPAVRPLIGYLKKCSKPGMA